MNHDRLMNLVPAGVVLAVAMFLGLAQLKVQNFYLLYTVIGYGAAIALMVIAAYDYRAKLARQRDR